MKYIVRLDATANVDGYARIEANSPEEAEDIVSNSPRLADWEMEDSYPSRRDITFVTVDEEEV